MTTSFEEFHRGRRAEVLAYASAALGGDGAEDACQEAWIRAWAAWGSTPPERLEGWMHNLVQTCCARRLAAPPSEPLAEEQPLAAPSFEDDSVAALDVNGMLSLLRSLPAPLREVLFLRGVLDLSYAEIAEVQQVPMGTVMSRLYEARRRARNRLVNSKKIEYSGRRPRYLREAGP